jgi:hypothetical protein
MRLQSFILNFLSTLFEELGSPSYYAIWFRFLPASPAQPFLTSVSFFVILYRLSPPARVSLKKALQSILTCSWFVVWGGQQQPGTHMLKSRPSGYREPQPMLALCSPLEDSDPPLWTRVRCLPLKKTHDIDQRIISLVCRRFWIKIILNGSSFWWFIFLLVKQIVPAGYWNSRPDQRCELQ